VWLTQFRLFCSKLFGDIFTETLSRLKPRILLVVSEQVSNFLRLRTLAPFDDSVITWRSLKSNGNFMLSQLGCTEIVLIGEHWAVMLSKSTVVETCGSDSVSMLSLIVRFHCGLFAYRPDNQSLLTELNLLLALMGEILQLIAVKRERWDEDVRFR